MFTVRVKDKATGREADVNVSRNSVIDTQEKAEAHVLGLPGSVGGTHPGHEVVKAPEPPKE